MVSNKPKAAWPPTLQSNRGLRSEGREPPCIFWAGQPAPKGGNCTGSVKDLRAPIVDPNKAGRRQVAGLLHECCFDSVEAVDGVDALRFASENGIHLIITEMRIAPPNVLRFLHVIRCDGFGLAQPPAIMCSASFHDQAWQTRSALRWGGDTAGNTIHATRARSAARRGVSGRVNCTLCTWADV